MVKNPVQNSIFRDNIIHALDNTASDEELRKELHKLLSKEVEKKVPYLVRPFIKINKTIH